MRARLRVELSSPWWAGFVSYFVGVLAMLAAVVAPGEPLLSGAMAARASWPSWTGGLFGAVLIGTAILMVPRQGAALLMLGAVLIRL